MNVFKLQKPYLQDKLGYHHQQPPSVHYWHIPLLRRVVLAYYTTLASRVSVKSFLSLQWCCLLWFSSQSPLTTLMGWVGAVKLRILNSSQHGFIQLYINNIYIAFNTSTYESNESETIKFIKLLRKTHINGVLTNNKYIEK